MIEDVIEIGLTGGRIRAAVEDAELTSTETELLIGLAPGEWMGFAAGRPMASLTILQETRARLAVELIGAMSQLLPSVQDVGRWIRSTNPVLNGSSPLEWTAGSLSNLRAVVGAVRLECGG